MSIDASKIAITVAVAIAGFCFGLWIDGADWGFLKDALLPAVATLAGAYGGAKYAFQLGDENERRRVLDRHRVSANIAIWQLVRMLNKLLSYKQQYIDVRRRQGEPNFAIEASLPLADESMRVDMGSIAFLLESAEPNVLGEVSVAEDQFRSTVALIDERSKFFLQEVQPRMQAAGIMPGEPVVYEQAYAALGPHVLAAAEKISDDVAQSVEKVAMELTDLCNKMHRVVKTVVENGKVISLVSTVAAPE